jgi:hypothetical protein
VPGFEKPFDKRILGAYVLTDAHLEKARELKIGYDRVHHPDWIRGLDSLHHVTQQRVTLVLIDSES